MKPPLCGAGDCLAFATRGWSVTVWPKGEPAESRGRGATIHIGLYVCEHHGNLVTLGSLRREHWQEIETWWREISDVPFDRDSAEAGLVLLSHHSVWRAKQLAAGERVAAEPAGGYAQSFVAQLSWEQLGRLREAVKRVWRRKGVPEYQINDRLADQTIEAMGPATREKWLKAAVDRALSKQ